MKRGKESAASLSVIVAMPGQRPGPPAELNDAEASTWRDIVKTKPADWFGADSAPLLADYCRHAIRQRLLSDLINAFDRARLKDEEGLKWYDRLLTMSERESRVISSLGTKLRLTPQSRYGSRAAAAAHRNTSTAKPWE